MDKILKTISPTVWKNIQKGKQSIILTKQVPKMQSPYICYLYKAQDNNRKTPSEGRLVGSCIVEEVLKFPYIENISIPNPSYEGDDSEYQYGSGYYITSGEFEKMCVSEEYIDKYGNGNTLYGLRVTNVLEYTNDITLEDVWVCKNKKEKCKECDYAITLEDVTICTTELYRAPSNFCYIKSVKRP